MSTPKPQIIAFYLPQFHPVQENSDWWGPGFTEWHNVAKARPLFRGHMQPKLPGELGFYDLRLDKTRFDQASLAREHGIYGFCYWHYWFGGERILETPLEEVIESGEPDFPFCVGWANESWTGVWHGSPKKILKEQRYPDGDPVQHYQLLRRFFHDPRYIRHMGKPLLYIYKPRDIPNAGRYLEELRRLAALDGFPGLYILGTWTPNPGGRYRHTSELGLDGAVITNISGRDSHSPSHWIKAVWGKIFGFKNLITGPQKIPYSRAAESMIPPLNQFEFPAYNCVISNWDNTPRSGRRGLVLIGGTADLFKSVLKKAFSSLDGRQWTDGSANYVFLKSWNEWAEGNYVEPDFHHGRDFLQAIAEALSEYGKD